MRLPAATAEALEGTLQPSAVGPWVHGADADCSVSCHVRVFKAGKVFRFLLISLYYDFLFHVSSLFVCFKFHASSLVIYAIYTCCCYKGTLSLIFSSIFSLELALELFSYPLQPESVLVDFHEGSMHQVQFGVQFLAQRHFFMLTGGVWDQTTNPLTSKQTHMSVDLFQQKTLDFWLVADPIYLQSCNHLTALRAVWSCTGQSEWCKWSWKEIPYLLWL